MKLPRLSVRIGSALAALACASSIAIAQETAHEPLSSFPRSRLEIQSEKQRHEFKVWIADTPSRREQGLMYITTLQPMTGMLFLFPEPRAVSMWMKNTRISLDMLFVSADGHVIRIAPKTKPESLGTISSMGLVTGVIEIAGGEAQRLGIRTGDRVIHPAFGTT